MIAPRILPPAFDEWNHRFGAPFGHTLRGERLLQTFLGFRVCQWLRGPFALQHNNTTRAFEYPWAFYAVAPSRGLTVVEVGGGLSGLQFVLDRFGCRVVNVDPGTDDSGRTWNLPRWQFVLLNRMFRTRVRLIPAAFSVAGLPPGSSDRVVALSVLEHLSVRECHATFAAASRCLRRGGLFILTVDLFLDLHPFSSRVANVYGTNIDLYRLVRDSPFELLEGLPAELYGFPEFQAERILAELDRYLIGSYPALAQCLVLRKGDGAD